MFQEKEFCIARLHNLVINFQSWLTDLYITQSGKDGTSTPPVMSRNMRLTWTALKENGYVIFGKHQITELDGLATMTPEQFGNTIDALSSEVLKTISDIASEYHEALSLRFPSGNYLSHFGFLNPNNFPHIGCTDYKVIVHEYDMDEMNKLMEFYGTAKYVGGSEIMSPLFDSDLVKSEWERLRPNVLKYASDISAKLSSAPTQKERERPIDVLDFWAHILRLFSTTYPLICAFIRLFLTVPSSTAEVERGFSLQNIIKSKLRNRLKVANLDAMMRLRLLGPSVQDIDKFDIDEMVKRWNRGAGIPRKWGRHDANHFTSDFLDYESDMLNLDVGIEHNGLGPAHHRVEPLANI